MKYIQEIHDSNLFGVVIETGCSAAIASTLMNVAGSSKTIYRTEQPYNKEYQENLYGKFDRSVSREWIRTVLELEHKKAPAKVNFILASSWQLLDPTNPLVYAHGWIGLFDIKRNVKHYLHFSFNRTLFKGYKALIDEKFAVEYIQHKIGYDSADRNFALQMIGQISCSILHTAINGDIKQINYAHSKDIILDNAYINDNINYDLLISNLEKVDGDYFLVFDKGNVIRIEDLMRKSNEFVIQKGSFNPLHHGHIRQVTGTHEKYPNALPAFLISTFRYDKPHINYDELKERIDMFAKAGYPLIICKSVLFYETFSLLKKWSYDKQFYFTVGYDTLNRIYKTDFDWVTENIQNVYSHAENLRTFIDIKIKQYKDNIKFLLFERKDFPRLEETHLYDEMVEYIHVPDDDGISSSKIRNGELENKINL